MKCGTLFDSALYCIYIVIFFICSGSNPRTEAEGPLSALFQVRHLRLRVGAECCLGSKFSSSIYSTSMFPWRHQQHPHFRF